MRARSILSLILVHHIFSVAACGPPGSETMPNKPMSNFEDDAGSAPGVRLDASPVFATHDAGMMAGDHLDAAVVAPDAAMTTNQRDAGGLDSSVPSNPVAGIWAMKMAVSQLVPGPQGQSTSEVTTILSRWNVTQTAGGMVGTMHVCALSVAGGGGLAITFPQPAIDAFPDVRSSPMVNGMGQGATITFPPTPQIAGWSSTATATDPLPTTANDPRVRDSDRDGHPGVTADISGPATAQLYLVSRTVVHATGTFTRPDHVEGFNTTTIEKALVGGSNPRIPEGPLPGTPDPNPNASFFKMSRIDTAANTCADIIANATALFP